MMRLPRFRYLAPRSLSEASAALADLGPEALPVAGGTDLFPNMKRRQQTPAVVVGLRGVSGLRTVSGDPARGLSLGAMTRLCDVAGDRALAAGWPALARAASLVGTPPLRNMGTIGGSVANNDPAADYPAGLLALGATVITDRRRIAADDFFTGLFETALAGGEIITAVSFPVPARAAYMKFKNPASRYAIVGVFVAKLGAEQGGGVRVAVTGAAPVVFRVAAMEQALAGSFAPEAIANIVVPDEGLNSDIHAQADHRAHLITVMAMRAVEAASS